MSSFLCWIDVRAPKCLPSTHSPHWSPSNLSKTHTWSSHNLPLPEIHQWLSMGLKIKFAFQVPSLLFPPNPDWRHIEIFAIPQACRAFYSFVTWHTMFLLLTSHFLPLLLCLVYIFLFNRHILHWYFPRNPPSLPPTLFCWVFSFCTLDSSIQGICIEPVLSISLPATVSLSWALLGE